MEAKTRETSKKLKRDYNRESFLNKTVSLVENFQRTCWVIQSVKEMNCNREWRCKTSPTTANSPPTGGSPTVWARCTTGAWERRTSGPTAARGSAGSALKRGLCPASSSPLFDFRSISRQPAICQLSSFTWATNSLKAYRWVFPFPPTPSCYLSINSKLPCQWFQWIHSRLFLLISSLLTPSISSQHF